MDAANYISTLELIAPRTTAPENYDFAILDLASAETLLEQIYSGTVSERIEWWSLFEGTSWQPDWASGPILIDLRDAPGFRTQLRLQLESSSMGILITSGYSAEELRQHLTRWVFESLPAKQQLLRFYEPRMFAPLLCVLSKQSRQNFLAVGHQWYWHDGHVWHESRGSNQPADELRDSGQVVVSATELKNSERYWLAGEASGYATYYDEALGHTKRPAVWVFNCLEEAQKAGFLSAAYLERWLRLALRLGADFHHSEPYQEVLSRDDLSPRDRLIAMESMSEKAHANNS